MILGHSWFDEICDSIKYLISEKSGIVVLQIVLIIILQELELITSDQIILLYKKYQLFIIL